MHCLRYMAAAAALAALFGCKEPPREGYQGYAEGEYVRVAAPFAGRLLELSVQRGASVEAGMPLFTLEQESEAAGRQEAEQRVRTAEAQVADLRKGKRAPEVETVRAQLEQARAGLRLSESNLKRQQQLVAANFVSKERVEEARTGFERDSARVAELEAQVATSRLAGRVDEIRAAEANVAVAKAALAQAQWRLSQKTVEAPAAGLVNDTNYVAGEWVPAGSPVVSLLPPQNIKARFFVPQTLIGSIRVGQALQIHCDGCPAPIAARVSFISPQAEYTPPVIYSREARAKLVFLVEARTSREDATRLHPGQPLDVRLATGVEPATVSEPTQAPGPASVQAPALPAAPVQAPVSPAASAQAPVSPAASAQAPVSPAAPVQVPRRGPAN